MCFVSVFLLPGPDFCVGLRKLLGKNFKVSFFSQARVRFGTYLLPINIISLIAFHSENSFFLRLECASNENIISAYLLIN